MLFNLIRLESEELHQADRDGISTMHTNLVYSNNNKASRHIESSYKNTLRTSHGL